MVNNILDVFFKIKIIYSGRILRDTNPANNINPKIVDFVDTFSVFNNQSKKRFNLYKKRKYGVKDIMLDIDNLKVLGTKEYNFKDKKSKKPIEENTKKIPQLSFISFARRKLA